MMVRRAPASQKVSQAQATLYATIDAAFLVYKAINDVAEAARDAKIEVVSTAAWTIYNAETAPGRAVYEATSKAAWETYDAAIKS